MRNWIKEIRKLAGEAEARKDASEAKGHPILVFFTDIERQSEKKSAKSVHSSSARSN
jgi:hypothetical protein